MQPVMRMPRRRPRRSSRRGSLTVEFAFLLPLLLTLLLGMIEASQLYEIHNQLATAVREGARLAAMDRAGMLAPGQSTNEKITQDIRNFLNEVGLPGDEVDVKIGTKDDPDVPFDLDDPNNDLQLFQVRVELPYSAISPVGIPGTEGYVLAAQLVLRNARAAAIVQ